MSQQPVMPIEKRKSPPRPVCAVPHVPRCRHHCLLVFLCVQPRRRCCCGLSLLLLALKPDGEAVSFSLPI